METRVLWLWLIHYYALVKGFHYRIGNYQGDSLQGKKLQGKVRLHLHFTGGIAVEFAGK